MNTAEYYFNLKELLIENIGDDVFDVFDGIIKFEDFADQILFESHINYFEIISTKLSMKRYVDQKLIKEGLDELSKDAIYQKIKRALMKTKDYKKNVNNALNDSNIYILSKSGLDIKDKENSQQKFKGYEFSESKYKQLELMSELRLLNDISKKRISNSKSLSNEDLEKHFDELDKFYQDLKSEFDNKSSVDVLVEIYHIEKAYMPNLVYDIAKYLDENQIDIKGIDFSIFNDLLGVHKAEIKSNSNGDLLFTNYFMENRFILKRNKYINEVVNKNVKEIANLKDICYLKTLLTHKCKIQLSGLHIMLYNHNKVELEQHLLKKYDLLSEFTLNKDWNNRRKKIVRKFYSELYKSNKSD